ncbi:MAG: hypothetical protein ACREUZ_05405, partial [Burkholderiales bacterium]
PTDVANVVLRRAQDDPEPRRGVAVVMIIAVAVSTVALESKKSSTHFIGRRARRSWRSWLLATIALLGPLNNIVMLTIACIKASLVILYVMHVRWGSHLTWVVVASGFFWLLIMFTFTTTDYLHHDGLPESRLDGRIAALTKNSQPPIPNSQLPG